MLLFLLAPIVRFALWIYFRHIEVRGRELVPSNRPLIFVANHPNVLLDSLLLASAIPHHRPRFLAKSTLFKRRFCAFLLRQLGAIPVARQQDGGRVGNQDMLRQACATLHSGGSLVFYPEGGSLAGRRVRPLKSGAARIALRAAEEGTGDVCIVPVGLTYAAPHLFRSGIEMHFGEPIEVEDFIAADRANRHRASNDLTAAIHARLVQLTWHLDSPELSQTIEDVNLVYAERLSHQLPANQTRSPLACEHTNAKSAA
jgi:1-acyl-sn-glycerol-3-phosphate acyltransferase